MSDNEKLIDAWGIQDNSVDGCPADDCGGAAVRRQLAVYGFVAIEVEPNQLRPIESQPTRCGMCGREWLVRWRGYR